MEREFIKSEFFLESTRTYLEKIFNINYQLIMTEKFDEYVLKSIFLQKIPTLRNILLSNQIPQMETLLFPLTKQKYEFAQEKLKNLLSESNSDDGEENLPLISAKIKFVKFKILSEIQLAIFDYLNLNKDAKLRNLIQNKITREFESLIFQIKFANYPENLNDKIVEELILNFVCAMPDNHLIEEIIVEIFQILELESDLVEMFRNKCKENKKNINENACDIPIITEPIQIKEKVSASTRKKRNFVQMQEKTIEKDKEEILENNPVHSIKSKKLKTIDNYFTKSDKELGFRNVKEKIEGIHSSNSKKDKDLTREEKILGTSSKAIFNKNALNFPQPITPHSIMAELKLPFYMNIPSNNFITKESLDHNMNNETLTADDYNNNESHHDIEIDQATKDKNIEDKVYTELAGKENESMSEMNLNDEIFKANLSSFQNSDEKLNTECIQYKKSDPSTSLSLQTANSVSHKYLDKNTKQNFLDLGTKLVDSSNNLTNSNNKSTNFSNLSLINSSFKMNSLETSSLNFNNPNENSHMTMTYNPLIRSNSNNMIHRGINSRLAGNIQNIPKTKKQKKTNSVRKKNSNEKIIEKFFDRIQNKIKEEVFDKKKDSKKLKEETYLKNSETKVVNSTTINNQLKKVINKQFYAKEKDLKSPSPIQVTCPKYSKRAKNLQTSNENIDINQNSNNSINSNLELTNVGMLTNSNTNSNMSTLEGRFDVLKNIKHNKSNNSSNAKKSPDIRAGLTFSGVGENNNLIILNRIKNQVNTMKNDNNSDDEILVYATPTKTNENIKFGKKSPNPAISSKVNLMNLFNQFKQKK